MEEVINEVENLVTRIRSGEFFRDEGYIAVELEEVVNKLTTINMEKK